MEAVSFALVAVLIIGLIGFLIWDRQKMRGLLENQKTDVTTAVRNELSGNLGVFASLNQQLGELNKSAKTMEDVGKSLVGLQEALRAPKFRGGFGEVGLERLLEDCLPSYAFKIQYPFKNGDTVDAAVNIGEHIVSIDAKFPFSLDEFSQMMLTEKKDDQVALRKKFIKAIKKHVEDIASKYIKPDEKTYDFALMYIPAESVYYETIIRCPDPNDENDVYCFCKENRVFPVSPNSLYAYLQAIALGLKGLQIEKSALEMLGHLNRIQVDLRDFHGEYDLVGKHLRNLATNYGISQTKLNGLEQRIELASSDSKTKVIE